ncbi:hypothetical protein [Niabella hibiscisoli]|uniref:hypothetical protein n=1 Tax=Niabella hibiscisoli TaxID=1825928 RepID=UPI001F118933|nr:hypothetical protein [Niabella hibiscisoli]MCH5719885.1 hypothetical protein [Niabella hibiscisoli]
MEITGKKILTKLKAKNGDNQKLGKAIDKLLYDLEAFDPLQTSLADVRKDADCAHSDGFYFFDIAVHRVFILVDLDEDGEATIIWAGSHDEYERTFKNNKSTIEKWLRSKGYIE